jgi:hypothetical protein
MEQLALFEADRPVSMEELRALWAKLETRGELWNGMTGHYLAEKYGARLYRVRGIGWFVRPENQVA